MFLCSGLPACSDVLKADEVRNESHSTERATGERQACGKCVHEGGACEGDGVGQGREGGQLEGEAADEGDAVVLEAARKGREDPEEAEGESR